MDRDEAFQKMYQQYRAYAAEVARKIIKDRSAAEDISQEVFYHLYRLGDALDMSNERMLRSLITTATINKARDYLKKAYVQREICMTDDEKAALPQRLNTYDPDELTAHIEAEQSLKMVLQKLRAKSPDNYDILVKVKILDIPARVVAMEYGISVHNVSSRISRTKAWIIAEWSKQRKE